jgi:hypothetical protein
MKLLALQVFQIALLAAACSPTSETNDAGGSGGWSASGGGPSGSGGTSSGGSSGEAASGGATSSGGDVGAGGATTGGAASGGGASGGASGGAASGGAPSGGAPGSGGGESLLEIAQALDGLRVDDPCAGTPAISTGATCDHAVLTGPGFLAEQEVSIEGTTGTTYDVTLRIRGIVEPANVVGGTRETSETFSYMGLDWRTEPVTLGGSVPEEDTDYAQWRLTVGEPSAVYFLNDYQRVGHYIFELDYEVTIPMQAGSTVTLEGIDANERLIVNYEGYAPEGIAGSSNHGQFVELELVSVTEQ